MLGFILDNKIKNLPSFLFGVLFSTNPLLSSPKRIPKPVFNLFFLIELLLLFV